VAGLTAAPNSFIRMRTQVYGANPTNIRMRAWADGTAEPSNWQLSVTDSSPVLQAAGVAGARVFLSSGQTNLPISTSFDDIVIQPLRPTTTRSIAYTYDGLQRLLTASESGASSNTYGYTYDNAGNRLTSTVNGSTTTRTYNAANQVIGWTYDAVGNLMNDGTTSYTYDALGRQKTTGLYQNSYNGDGMLVGQSIFLAVAIWYTPDLASPLPRMLKITNDDPRTDVFVYGDDLLNVSTTTMLQPKTTTNWHTTDALGSVRATLDTSGNMTNVANYDPYGQVQSGTVDTFGFTGELQQGSSVYLRARWYNASAGTLFGRDPFAGYPETPYSLHAYQYGYANPVSNTDPSGLCTRVGDDYCYPEPPVQPVVRPVPPPVPCGTNGQAPCTTATPVPEPRRDTTSSVPPIAMAGAVLFAANPAGITFAVCAVIYFSATAARTMPQTEYVLAPVDYVVPQPTPLVPPVVISQPTSTPNRLSTFMPGADMPQTTQHIDDAISASKPSIVTYRGPNNGHSRRWLRSEPACRGNSLTIWCDEYPFNSVEEGGQANRPSLRLVPASEQRTQAGKWTQFLYLCQVSAYEKVEIRPSLANRTTTWTCK
jgi:RHS repeat-associated protein